MMNTQWIETDRLRIAYHRAGEGKKKKLLFLHGNLSSSVYILPLFPELEKEYDILAPDLRSFGETEALPIDATRGYRDWSDDLYALCEALGWKRFFLCGWSMGGDIAMQFTIDHPSMVEKLVLLAPGPPYGFGGTRDAKGTPSDPVGLGSGGGCAHPGMVMALEHRSRFFLRDILKQYYFTPPFRMSQDWEDRLLEAITKIQVGEDAYPGNYSVSDTWPYVVAGDKGVLNAMSPRYADLSPLLEIKKKPPILWIHGKQDRIVSDTSIMEFGYLGELGLVPGWPGVEVYPPQPMITQLRRFFKKYEKSGGQFSETLLPGGHLCALESPVEFLAALHAFLL